MNAKSFGTRPVFYGAQILYHLLSFFTCDNFEQTKEQTLLQLFHPHFQMHVHQNNVMAQICILYIFQYEPVLVGYSNSWLRTVGYGSNSKELN
jgi:hypothetical protein